MWDDTIATALQVEKLEWAFLASLLEEPHHLHEAMRQVQPGDLTHDGRKAIYAAIIAEAAQGRAPDVVETPIAILRYPGVTPDVLCTLTPMLNGQGNVRRYATAVERRAMVRRALWTLREAPGEIERADDPPEALRALGANLTQMAAGRSTGKRTDHTVGDLVEQSLVAMDARLLRTGLGLSTGLRDLDRIMRLDPGRLYIIAGRPGMGKSSLAAQWVRATVEVSRWGVISLEMSGREWLDRLLCLEAGVDLKRYTDGELDQADVDAICDASVKVRESWNLRIDDRGGATMPYIAAKAREWAAIGGLDGLVVDYLQITGKRDGRIDQLAHVTEVSGQCKQLARELEIPVVLLSQLSREVEKRGDKRPMPSDLRDSGAIEQDADVIAFVYRDAVYVKGADETQAEIIVAKQRGGPTGVAHVRWDGHLTRFSDGV